MAQGILSPFSSKSLLTLIIACLLPISAIAEDDGDATSYVQNLINQSSVVDLKGQTFEVATINLHSNLVLKNGHLISKSDVVLNADHLKNVRIENVEIDGSRTSRVGIYLNYVESAKISKCKIHNIYSSVSGAYAIQLKRCTASTITESEVFDVESVPNGKGGDVPGSSRGILIQACSNVKVEGNHVYRIISSEDGDGIHCINETSSENDHITIRNNRVEDCSRRFIKIQARGVKILNNVLRSESEKYVEKCGIAVFASDCEIKNNTINSHTPMPIRIGESGQKVSNVIIANNTIHYKGGTFRGAINMYTDVSGVVVKNNDITIAGASAHAFYLEDNLRDIQLKRNHVNGGKGLLYIRQENAGDNLANIKVSSNTISADQYLMQVVATQKASKVDEITVKSNKVSLHNSQGDSQGVILKGIKSTSVKARSNRINKK